MVRHPYPLGLVEQALRKVGPHAGESDDDILEFTKYFYNELVTLYLLTLSIYLSLSLSYRSVSILFIPRQFIVSG